MKKNKKTPLVALVLLLIVGIVGGTIAYFSGVANFENVFQSQTFKTVATETFDAPENWTPGTITPKTIEVKNEGKVPVVVRVTEVSKEWAKSDGTKINEPDGAEKGAIIHYSNTDKWKKLTGNDNVYYYYEVLNQNAIAPSYIESVEYNERVSSNSDGSVCTETTGENNKKIITCEAKDYAGATYKLTLKVETVQADLKAIKSVFELSDEDITTLWGAGTIQ